MRLNKDKKELIKKTWSYDKIYNQLIKLRAENRNLRIRIIKSNEEYMAIRFNKSSGRQVIFNIYIKPIFGILSDREQKILMMRFGFDDGVTKTLEEVSKELGVTRERIRQIETKALERYKKQLRKIKES